MPAPTSAPTPVQTPVVTPTPLTMPGPQPELYPNEICPQQKREHASPDIAP